MMLTRKNIRAFFKRKQGATAMETALLLVPSTAVMFLLFEFCISFSTAISLEGVAQTTASRLNSGSTEAEAKAYAQKSVLWFSKDCVDISISNIASGSIISGTTLGRVEVTCDWRPVSGFFTQGINFKSVAYYDRS